MSVFVGFRISDDLANKVDMRCKTHRMSKTDVLIAAIERGWEEVPVIKHQAEPKPESLPIHPRTHINPLSIPGVSLGKDFFAGNHPELPDVPAFMPEVRICPYREYSGDIGEWVECGLAEHSHKVKHGKWR